MPSILGSITDAEPEEVERFDRLYTALSEWVKDDEHVKNEDFGALVNVLCALAIQVAQQLGGDRRVFLEACENLWKAYATKKKTADG